MSEKQADQNFNNSILQSEQSEFLFKNILNKSQDLICIVGMDGYFKYTNPAWGKIIGYTESELLSKPIFDFMHPGDHKLSGDEIGKLMTGQYAIDFENRYIHKDGSIRRISWMATPDPETQLIYCIGRDITIQAQLTKELDEHRSNLEDIVKRRTAELQQEITERKRTEDVLYRSEILLKSSIESPKDMIILSLDSKYRYLYFNNIHLETMSHVYGALPQVGDSIFDHMNVKDDINKLKAHYDRALSGEGHIAIEEYGEGKSSYYYEVQYNPIYDGKNKIIGITAFAQNITDRIKTEKKLRLQGNVLDQINDYVTITDLDGAITYVNQAQERAMGFNTEDVVGNMTDVYGKDPTQGVTQKEILESTLKNDVWRGEVVNKTKDGCELIVDCRTQVIRNKTDEPICMVGIGTDITERKKVEKEKIKLEAQLQQAQKMESIGNLAGGIAHDFNNLLFPIIGMSEMLLEDLPEDSPDHENVREIFHAGKRVADLVNQILAFSRQSEHKMTPVRVQNILKEVLKLSRSTIPTNIEIQQNIQQNCGLIIADSTQIHQVAMNLITNAYHAIEGKNGTIDVELKEKVIEENELPDSEILTGKYVRLSVSDNGTGIPQNVINGIFEPYFTTKEKGKGTGLGLAVVYGIVKEHGGDIKVQSKIGEGTTFTVYFPLMKKSSDIISTDKVSDAATGTENILLVDDELSVAKLESLMLSRLGYHLTVETNSEDALNTFKSNPNSFDLVISDMTMPNMTGDQLAKELLSIKADIPIIICTGFSERINKEQAEIIGVKGFLMKPVVKLDMAQMVRKILDEAKNS